jgi:hypothetical protein
MKIGAKFRLSRVTSTPSSSTTTNRAPLELLCEVVQARQLPDTLASEFGVEIAVSGFLVSFSLSQITG